MYELHLQENSGEGPAICVFRFLEAGTREPSTWSSLVSKAEPESRSRGRFGGCLIIKNSHMRLHDWPAAC